MGWKELLFEDHPKKTRDLHSIRPQTAWVNQIQSCLDGLYWGEQLLLITENLTFIWWEERGSRHCLKKLSVNFIKNLHGEGVIFTSLPCLINIYWLHVKWDSFKLERSFLGSTFSLSDWLKPVSLREARVRPASSISFPSGKMHVLLLIRIWGWKPRRWVSVSCLSSLEKTSVC